MTYRVAFLTTHPIQYQVPVFRCMEDDSEFDFEVLFCQLPSAGQQGDGFGVEFQWDIPLLEGYAYQVLDNVAADPSVTTYRGCDTPSLRGVIKKGRYDAVVINGWVVKSCLQGLSACRQLRVPCIVRGEANDLGHRPLWKRLLQSMLVRRYAACLTIGTANRQFYLRRGVDEAKLFAARYCVENDRFASQAQQRCRSRDQIRASWGIDPASTCYLYSGKLVDKKHPVELLRAFAAAARRGAHAHLLVVGDGELRAQCETILKDTDAPVTMAGFLNQSQIVDAYVASDCLVLPSDSGETWGLVANEAMACSRPALVSNLAGCSQDLIVPDRTGEILPFADWQAWEAAMFRWSGRRDRLAEMGELARKHIEGFTPHAAAEGIKQAVRFVSKSRS